MRTIESTGKTVDEAISVALQELNLSLSDVKIEILEEGNRDLEIPTARVRVSEKVKSEIGNKAGSILKELLSKMGMSADVIVIEEGDTIRLDIRNTPHGALLIGFRGKTLNSLQYLVHQMVNRNGTPDEQRYDIEVDIQDYRERRRKLLSRMATEAIGKVDLTGKPVELEPMSAYDRKYIHMLVKDEVGFSTTSMGEGQDRHIVISKGNYDVSEVEDMDTTPTTLNES